MTASVPHLSGDPARVPGSLVQVVGASGAGLSQLAHRLVEEPPSQWHGSVALVLEDPRAHITGLRDTVAEEVAFPLEQRGVSRIDMRRRVHKMLTLLGLQSLAERHPARLSGGETQRVAVAIAAVIEPRVLILDGSFAGLDVESREALCCCVRELLTTGTGVLVLGHQPVPELEGELWFLGPRQRPHPRLPNPVRDPEGEAVIAGVRAQRSTLPRRRWSGRPPALSMEAQEFSVGPIDLRVPRGGVLWLRGANGSGKTSLLRAAAGLDDTSDTQPSRGGWLKRQRRETVPRSVALALQNPQDQAGVACRPQEILALDEPDVGLDVHGRETVHAILAEQLTARRPIILTCHDPQFLSEVSAYAVVEACWVPTISSSNCGGSPGELQ